MKLVVSMMLLFTLVGLFGGKVTRRTWWTLLAGVTLIVIYNYYKYE